MGKREIHSNGKKYFMPGFDFYDASAANRKKDNF